MYRYVDAIFRHKLLVLLPLLLIPLLGAGLGVFMFRSYEVRATIWADASPLFNLKDGATGYQPSSQVEAEAFNERLKTRTFMKELMDRTGLVVPEPVVEAREGITGAVASLLDELSRSRKDPVARLDQTIERLRGGFKVESQGPHLVAVSFRGDDPETAARLVSGAIDLYREKQVEVRADQTRAATEFYQAQLRDYEQRMRTSSDALKQYKEANGSFASIGGNDPDRVAKEQSLVALEQQYSWDKTLYEAALSRMDEARMAGEGDLRRVSSLLRVADPPVAPSTSELDKEKAVMLGLIGLIVGLILGLGAVVATVWANPSVQSAEELREVPGVELLATVPRMSPPRGFRSPYRGREETFRWYMGGLISDHNPNGDNRR